MRALKIILVVLAFISLQAHAKDDGRNLVVKQNASAGKRIALVIGNGNYQNSDSLPKLANPTHDAEDIAKALRGFGFEVIEKKDQSLEGMSDAITEFSRKIGDSEAALFYFAGHGLQVKGQNYIIPVDAKIETEAQVPFKSINVNLILEEMDNGKGRANIVMLDACRNNPISGKFRSGATRGLAAPTSQPKGTVIVYATDPGNVAADGNGRNGLFTAGLLTAFKGSDLSLHGVLSRASEEVERGSAQKQTPYINGPATLQNNFQFAPSQATQVASLVPAPAPAQPAARVKSREEIEQDGWESARDSANIDAIQEYLKQYPKGRFAGQAKILIATLKTAPAKPAEPIASPVREDGESALWAEAQKGNSKDDYDAYLGQYPKGKYVALAKSRIKKLQDEAAAEATRREQDAWEAANSMASEAGYQGYLKSWPTGQYAGLAQIRLRKLQTDLAALQEAARQRQQAEAAQAAANGPAMVRIPGKNYEIGKYEVTQAEWRAVMNNNPSFYRNCGDTCPVEQVSWDDAQAFIRNLNAKTGKQYRLPTEAEWEYACYGGSQTEYCGGNDVDAVAWTYDNGNKQTHPAGQKQANSYGLYDMSGNVWEWMNDCWEGDCTMRAFRGSSAGPEKQGARASIRNKTSVAGRYSGIGFRLARTLP